MITRRRAAVLVCVVFGIGAVLLLRGIPDAVGILRGFRGAARAVARAEAVWRSGGPQSAPDAVEHLHSASLALGRARDLAESAFVLRALPGIRGALVFAHAVSAGGMQWVDGAAVLADIAAEGYVVATELGPRSLAALTPAEYAALSTRFTRALGRARSALALFDAGDRALAGTSCPILVRLVAVDAVRAMCRGGALQIEAIPGFTTLRTLRDNVERVVSAADAVTALAGDREPHSAMLLFLNSAELRPGGGFLGTYGIATFQDGALRDLRTDDVYALDRRAEGAQRVPLPEPFRVLNVPYWYLRDANWSPDFAVSAREVLGFYEREGGIGNPEVVVGFTPEFGAALLRIVGPITVAGVEFTAANLADALEYEVEKGYYVRGIPEPRRKAIIAPLARTVADRLRALPYRTWRDAVLPAVRTAIRERQLMVYAVDPAAQHLVEEYDAGGRVRAAATGDDTLLVVDANIGSLKTDPVIQRSIRYAVIPDGAGYRGVILLRYRNTGTYTWKTTRYRTYTRVYLPIGTELITARGAMRGDRPVEGVADISEELGRAVFGAFLHVDPGQEQSLAFEVRLAPAVVDRIRNGSYQLIAQKQLGSLATPLTLDLEFGTPVETANPPEPPAAWGDGRYHIETDLRADREFRVGLHTP